MSLNIITVTLNMGEWEVCLQSFQSEVGWGRRNWGGGKESTHGEVRGMGSLGKWLALKRWCLKSSSASQEVSLGERGVQVPISSAWFI